MEINTASWRAEMSDSTSGSGYESDELRPFDLSHGIDGRYRRLSENVTAHKGGAIEELILHRLPGEKMGMVLGIEKESDGWNNVRVRSVSVGGAAQRATGSTRGICDGDELVAINGVELGSLSHSQCIDVFREIPLQVTVVLRRCSEERDSATSRTNERTYSSDSDCVSDVCDDKKWDGKFRKNATEWCGFREDSLRSSLKKNNASLISANSLPCREETDNGHQPNDDLSTPMLRRGSLTSLNRPKIRDLVCKRELSIEDERSGYVADVSQAKEEPGMEQVLRECGWVTLADCFTVHRITLTKQPGEALGLSIVPSYGTTKYFYQIKRLLPSGACCRDNQLQIGDRILFVNGVSLRGVKQQRCTALLRDTSDVVNFIVLRLKTDRGPLEISVTNKKTRNNPGNVLKNPEESNIATNRIPTKPSRSTEESHHKLGPDYSDFIEQTDIDYLLSSDYTSSDESTEITNPKKQTDIDTTVNTSNNYHYPDSSHKFPAKQSSLIKSTEPLDYAESDRLKHDRVETNNYSTSLRSGKVIDTDSQKMDTSVIRDSVPTKSKLMSNFNNNMEDVLFYTENSENNNKVNINVNSNNEAVSGFPLSGEFGDQTERVFQKSNLGQESSDIPVTNIDDLLFDDNNDNDNTGAYSVDQQPHKTENVHTTKSLLNNNDVGAFIDDKKLVEDDRDLLNNHDNTQGVHNRGKQTVKPPDDESNYKLLELCTQSQSRETQGGSAGGGSGSRAGSLARQEVAADMRDTEIEQFLYADNSVDMSMSEDGNCSPFSFNSGSTVVGNADSDDSYADKVEDGERTASEGMQSDVTCEHVTKILLLPDGDSDGKQTVKHVSTVSIKGVRISEKNNTIGEKIGGIFSSDTKPDRYENMGANERVIRDSNQWIERRAPDKSDKSFRLPSNINADRKNVNVVPNDVRAKCMSLDRKAANLMKPQSNPSLSGLNLHTAPRKTYGIVSLYSRSELGPFQIDVLKSVIGLGVRFQIANDGFPTVAEIQRGSPIAKNGQIRLGDYVLSLNGTDITRMSEKKIQQIVRLLPRGLVKVVASVVSPELLRTQEMETSNAEFLTAIKPVKEEGKIGSPLESFDVTETGTSRVTPHARETEEWQRNKSPTSHYGSAIKSESLIETLCDELTACEDKGESVVGGHVDVVDNGSVFVSHPLPQLLFYSKPDEVTPITACESNDRHPVERSPVTEPVDGSPPRDSPRTVSATSENEAHMDISGVTSLMSFEEETSYKGRVSPSTEREGVQAGDEIGPGFVYRQNQLTTEMNCDSEHGSRESENLIDVDDGSRLLLEPDAHAGLDVDDILLLEDGDSEISKQKWENQEEGYFTVLIPSKPDAPSENKNVVSKEKDADVLGSEPGRKPISVSTESDIVGVQDQCVGASVRGNDCNQIETVQLIDVEGTCDEGGISRERDNVVAECIMSDIVNGSSEIIGMMDFGEEIVENVVAENICAEIASVDPRRDTSERVVVNDVDVENVVASQIEEEMLLGCKIHEENGVENVVADQIVEEMARDFNENVLAADVFINLKNDREMPEEQCLDDGNVVAREIYDEMQDENDLASDKTLEAHENIVACCIAEDMNCGVTGVVVEAPEHLSSNTVADMIAEELRENQTTSNEDSEEDGNTENTPLDIGNTDDEQVIAEHDDVSSDEMCDDAKNEEYGSDNETSVGAVDDGFIDHVASGREGEAVDIDEGKKDGDYNNGAGSDSVGEKDGRVSETTNEVTYVSDEMQESEKDNIQNFARSFVDNVLQQSVTDLRINRERFVEKDTPDDGIIKEIFENETREDILSPVQKCEHSAVTLVSVETEGDYVRPTENKNGKISDNSFEEYINEVPIRTGDDCLGSILEPIGVEPVQESTGTLEPVHSESKDVELSVTDESMIHKQKVDRDDGTSKEGDMSEVIYSDANVEPDRSAAVATQLSVEVDNLDLKVKHHASARSPDIPSKLKRLNIKPIMTSQFSNKIDRFQSEDNFRSDNARSGANHVSKRSVLAKVTSFENTDDMSRYSRSAERLKELQSRLVENDDKGSAAVDETITKRVFCKVSNFEKTDKPAMFSRSAERRKELEARLSEAEELVSPCASTTRVLSKVTGFEQTDGPSSFSLSAARTKNIEVKRVSNKVDSFEKEKETVVSHKSLNLNTHVKAKVSNFEGDKMDHIEIPDVRLDGAVKYKVKPLQDSSDLNKKPLTEDKFVHNRLEKKISPKNKSPPPVAQKPRSRSSISSLSSDALDSSYDDTRESAVYSEFDHLQVFEPIDDAQNRFRTAQSYDASPSHVQNDRMTSPLHKEEIRKSGERKNSFENIVPLPYKRRLQDVISEKKTKSVDARKLALPPPSSRLPWFPKTHSSVSTKTLTKPLSLSSPPVKGSSATVPNTEMDDTKKSHVPKLSSALRPRNTSGGSMSSMSPTSPRPNFTSHSPNTFLSKSPDVKQKMFKFAHGQREDGVEISKNDARETGFSPDFRPIIDLENGNKRVFEKPDMAKDTETARGITADDKKETRRTDNNTNNNNKPDNNDDQTGLDRVNKVAADSRDESRGSNVKQDKFIMQQQAKKLPENNNNVCVGNLNKHVVLECKHSVNEKLVPAVGDEFSTGDILAVSSPDYLKQEGRIDYNVESTQTNCVNTQVRTISAVTLDNVGHISERDEAMVEQKQEIDSVDGRDLEVRSIVTSADDSVKGDGTKMDVDHIKEQYDDLKTLSGENTGEVIGVCHRQQTAPSLSVQCMSPVADVSPIVTPSDVVSFGSPVSEADHLHRDIISLSQASLDSMISLDEMEMIDTVNVERFLPTAAKLISWDSDKGKSTQVGAIKQLHTSDQSKTDTRGDRSVDNYEPTGATPHSFLLTNGLSFLFETTAEVTLIDENKREETKETFDNKPACVVPNCPSEAGRVTVKSPRKWSVYSNVRGGCLYEGMPDETVNVDTRVTPKISGEDLARLMTMANKILHGKSVEKHELCVVTLVRGVDEKVGLTLKESGGNLMVCDVDPDSTVGKSGRVYPDDHVLLINGESTVGMTPSIARSRMRLSKDNLDLVVARSVQRGKSVVDGRKMVSPSQVTKAPTSDCGEIDIVIEKGVTGLGFCIEGGLGSPLGDRPVTIKRLFKGGAADKSGQLRPGDEICSVNGRSLANQRQYEAWNMIRFAPDGPLRLIIRRK